MHLSVFRNPALRSRATYPYVVVLQSDVSAGETRLVAPLLPPLGGAGKTLVPVSLAGTSLVVAVALMSAIPSKILTAPVASLSAYRDALIAAIDWVITGA